MNGTDVNIFAQCQNRDISCGADWTWISCVFQFHTRRKRSAGRGQTCGGQYDRNNGNGYYCGAVSSS